MQTPPNEKMVPMVMKYADGKNGHMIRVEYFSVSEYLSRGYEFLIDPNAKQTKRSK